MKFHDIDMHFRRIPTMSLSPSSDSRVVWLLVWVKSSWDGEDWAEVDRAGLMDRASYRSLLGRVRSTLSTQLISKDGPERDKI